ncbi:oxidoreductase [Sphaerisporangium album]|uniref:Oxidoreductase n=1 Tax=Sphaerisporangium album TaxID=509200 RepID=A0A367FJ22_9ACTN|nr:oxidoreductase [Sphaerisporangium album]RCG30314.1 oxidoreductase [Sphaerisporangium album]
MSDPLAVIAELPGVPEAVREARAAVDRLYGHRVLRRRRPEVTAESALRGARASAALEGADIPLDVVRSGRAESAVVQGALRVSSEVGRLGDIWRTAPRQVLARLHVLAAAGLVTDERLLGRPRTDAAPPAGPSSAEPSVSPSAPPSPASSSSSAPSPVASDVFSHVRPGVPSGLLDLDAELGLGPAPGSEATAARIASLAALISAPSEAPALVLAAIVHAEIVVLRPFGTADGLVARAAERLTLVEFGLDPKSLVTVEAGHFERREAYGESLRGYLKGTAEGVGGWVRHCAEAVRLGARETTAVCEALERG